MPLRHQSDFKQALSILQRLEKNHTCPFILTSTNNGRHKIHPLHGGSGKVPGGLLKIEVVFFFGGEME